MEIIAEGLQFPEGPIVMPDGSVILVEIQRKTLSRVWNGKTEVIAEIGGGPNGAAFGPDGAIYITNNGGFEYHDINGLTIPGNAAPDYVTGRIERVDLATSKVERLYDSIGAHKLSGPNDIVFDKSGGFWFTDLGKNYPRSSDRGGLYYAKPDGSLLKEVSYGHVGLNGVGLSPDETVVWRWSGACVRASPRMSPASKTWWRKPKPPCAHWAPPAPTTASPSSPASRLVAQGKRTPSGY